MTISAVILTKNEEEKIERCLKSVSWCDEIIVVDDNSTDQTGNIAKKFTSNVFNRSLNGDFSSQRNFGLEKAKSDWVIFIDADEELSKEITKEIQSTIDKSDVNGYLLRRKDYAFGKWLKYGETANVNLLRLARKVAGKWERPVHEVWKVKGNIKCLQNFILHYSHNDIISSLNKINCYTNIEASYRYEKLRSTNYLEILLYPAGKFLKNFVVYGGFLDGINGFLMASLMSFHSFLVRVKLWELQNRVSEKYSIK